MTIADLREALKPYPGETPVEVYTGSFVGGIGRVYLIEEMDPPTLILNCEDFSHFGNYTTTIGEP